MTETQIKAQEAKDFKDRQAKRARAKVLDIEISISCAFVCFCVVQGLAHSRACMMKVGPNAHATFPPPPLYFHQAKQNASAATNQQPGGDASAHGQSTASLPVAAGNTKADHQHPGASGGTTGVAGGSAAGAGGAGAGDDGADAGIDLSEEVYSAGADESGARVLCAWLNANVATTFMEVRRRSATC